MNLANEGLEAKKKEEEVNAKKRKAQDDANWEGAYIDCFSLQVLIYSIANRDQRVDTWRSFAGASKKKKKTKATLLG
jgi:DnaJ family protein C protein 8